MTYAKAAMGRICRSMEIRVRMKSMNPVKINHSTPGQNSYYYTFI